ncbi:MAG: hypothetical protein WC365_01055 [Candidatus Babeliales bacterium]|jgi:hypothetical protein
MANPMKQRQRAYEAFKNKHINALVAQHVLLKRRDGADGVIYEYILIDGSVKGWFKFHNGIVTYEAMDYTLKPVVVEDEISSEG